MTDTSTVAAQARAQSLPSRFIGVITSPKETFQAVAAHPRWFGMLALTCVSMAIIVGGFMFTQTGQDAWLDAATSRAGDVSDQQYEAMRRMADYAGYIAVVQMFVFIPLLYLIVGGILFAVFNAGLGGDATFKQLFAVIVHTGPIGVLAQLFTMPLNYMRGTLTSATNLSVLLPMLDETSFVGRLLGMIDLFVIWQLVVLAIGLGALYRRRTQPIAMWLFVAYGVIAALIAAVMSRLGGA